MLTLLLNAESQSTYYSIFFLTIVSFSCAATELSASFLIWLHYYSWKQKRWHDQFFRFWYWQHAWSSLVPKVWQIWCFLKAQNVILWLRGSRTNLMKTTMIHTALRRTLRICCSMQKQPGLICLQDFRHLLKEKIAWRLYRIRIRTIFLLESCPSIDMFNVFPYFCRWMRLLMCTVVSTATVVASKFLTRTGDTWEPVKLLCLPAHLVVGMICTNLLEWLILLSAGYFSLQYFETGTSE